MLKNNSIKKDTVKKILIEIASMVLAVLIALGANSWWVNSMLESNAEEAVEHMNKEIVGNYLKSKNLLPRIEKRYGIIDTLQIKRGGGFDNYLGAFNGFEIEQYRTTAWHRLTKSDFSNFVDQEYVNRVFELQGDIGKMQVIWSNVTELITSEILYEPSKINSAYKISKFLLKEEIAWLKLKIKNYENFIIEFIPEKVGELNIEIKNPE